MNSVSISIAITTYNQERFLARTLESILNQKHPYKYEIVIGDDFSTDGTMALLLCFQEKNPDIIRILPNKERTGFAETFHNVIRHCSGEYIMHCSVGDYWLPEKVYLQIQFMEAHHECGMLYAQALRSSEQNLFGSDVTKTSDLLFCNDIPPSAVVFRQDLLDSYMEEVQPLAKGWVEQVYPISLWFSLKKCLSFLQQPLVAQSFSKSDEHNFRSRLSREFDICTIKTYFCKLLSIPYILSDETDAICRLYADKAVAEHDCKNINYCCRRIIHPQKSDKKYTVKRHLAVVQSVLDYLVPDIFRKDSNSVVRLISLLSEKISRKLQRTSRIIARRKKVYVYRTPHISRNITDRLASFSEKPLISIILVVQNEEIKKIKAVLESIRSQWYCNREIVIVYDSRTEAGTVKFLEKNKSATLKTVYIEGQPTRPEASNLALRSAYGDYIAIMDLRIHLAPDALYETAKAVNEKSVAFIYSDNDIITSKNKLVHPRYKPDFSPDRILNSNYIGHFAVIKRDLVDTVSGFSNELDSSYDYDLYLRIFECTDRVAHVPKVLYHQEKKAKTNATSNEAACILNRAIRRRGLNAVVIPNSICPDIFRIKYAITGNPLVSIIIPFKDKPELLRICVESILNRSTYKNFEIICVSNNSTEEKTFDELKRLEQLDKRIHMHEYNVAFNYSAINNHAIRSYSGGSHIILLNNDIEIITPDWIESLLEFSQRDDVGAVGAKLYYPNGTIQHAGVVIGLRGLAAHIDKGLARQDRGYCNRLQSILNVSAVTAACLMVKRSLFDKLEGLNETALKVAFNDIDFCLRIREAGYLNVFTPYCEAYHHESISRGLDNTTQKKERFIKERSYMLSRYGYLLRQGDPYYNRNLMR